MESFGDVLRRHRSAAGLTQEELAERAGLSRRAISDLERGQRTRPWRDTVRLLAAALDLGAAERSRFEAARRPSPSAPTAGGGVPEPGAAVPRPYLPVPVSTFVGREREIGEVTRLLGSTRLLTLTGTGGCGKTRLALRIASDLAESYPDRVWLAELAPLADASLVPGTVAAVLGVREGAGQPIQASLLSFLRSRELLLVLDNCEHLIDGAARLADALLRGCPKLRIFATSREPLGIAGETSWRVPPLSTPATSPPFAPDQLLGYAAIRLFAERTAAARPGFALTERNAAAVVDICTRLDGMPLALELAAARVRSLPVEQLARRLDDRFRLLTGGSRTALPRQQTLRATIDWSHDLLSEPERVLFRRLSVFAGGWTLEAAEGVCGGEGLAAEEVLDLLTRLGDRSLVTLVDETSGEPRYRLLETIRQYAGEKLRGAGEEAVPRDRHRDWYLGLVDRAEPELAGPREGEWLDRLEREHDNLRAVLDRCLVGEPEAGLRVAGGLWWFWLVRGHYTEGRRWLEAMLAREPGPTIARAKALVGAGSLAQYQNDHARARPALEEGLAIARDCGDDAVLARGLAELGMLLFDRGDYARAASVLEEGLAAARRSRQPPANALWALNRLGVGAYLAGDLERARALLDQGLALARRVGSKRHLGWALGDLGQLLVSRGEYASARPLLEEGLALAREIGDREGMAWRLLHLGNLLRIQGEPGRARVLLAEGSERFADLGSDQGLGMARAMLANLEHREGHDERARELLAASLDRRLKEHDPRAISQWVWLLGVLEIARGAHARGARLIGAGVTHGLRQTYLSPLDLAEADAALQRARSALGEEAFAHAWAEGQALTLDQAAASALEEIGSEPVHRPYAASVDRR